MGLNRALPMNLFTLESIARAVFRHTTNICEKWETLFTLRLPKISNIHSCCTSHNFENSPITKHKTINTTEAKWNHQQLRSSTIMFLPSRQLCQRTTWALWSPLRRPFVGAIEISVPFLNHKLVAVFMHQYFAEMIWNNMTISVLPNKQTIRNTIVTSL